MRNSQAQRPRRPATRPWGPLLIMLGVVFILKLVVLLQLRDHPLTAPDAGLDTTAYVDLANRVLAGDWALGPALYHVSPFYIYFLAALLVPAHSFTLVRIIQILLGTASVGLIFLTARIWFGERAAWIAAVLAGLTGLFTFYEILILQSSVDAFLTSAALYALALGSRRGVGIAGLIWGLQSLNRPNVLIAAVGVALVMIVVLRTVKPAAILIGGVLIALAPVILRNAVVSHEFTLVSSHGGLNFYIGNNEHATGYYVNVPGVAPSIVGQERDTRRVAERALGRVVTDGEASSYFTGLARRWIFDHPGAAAALFAKKFGLSFHAAHVPLPHSYAFFAYDTPTALRFYAVGPWLLTPLGIVGLIVAARRDRIRQYLVWVSFVPAYAASVAIFFVADRYRLPLLVPLCVGAGAGVDRAVQAVRARSGSRSALAGLVLLLVLFGAANVPLAIDDGRWTEGLRLAQRLVLTGRDGQAEQWAEWLATHGGKPPTAGYYGVGLQYLTIGNAAKALPYLQKAYALDPSEHRTEYALGIALYRTGQTAAALDHLRRGFDAGVEIPDGGIDYALALDAAGDPGAADAAAARVSPADPDDPESWLKLGRIAMQAKAPRVAEPFFHRAVLLRPDLAAARQQYGLCLLVGRRVEEAARELAEAVRLDPRNADSLAHLAYCEAALRRSAEALAHARAALTLEPENTMARQLLYTLGGGSR